MTRNQVEEKTLNYHQSGFCCTEAILKSLTECYADRAGSAIPKMGSGFCKGVGKTGEDICGTVVGAVMALGFLFGRENKNKDLDPVVKKAAEFRERFVAQYGSTNCKALLEKFGQQAKMDKCKKMTAKASGIIADMLSDQ